MGSRWDLSPAISRLGYPPLLIWSLHLQEHACAFRHICPSALWDNRGQHTSTEAPWLSPIPCFHIKWTKGNEPMTKEHDLHFMLFWRTASIGVTCQQLRLRTFSVNMENSLTERKKPDSGAIFCRLCQYTRWYFQSGRHLIFAHLLKPLSCAPRSTALWQLLKRNREPRPKLLTSECVTSPLCELGGFSLHKTSYTSSLIYTHVRIL